MAPTKLEEDLARIKTNARGSSAGLTTQINERKVASPPTRVRRVDPTSDQGFTKMITEFLELIGFRGTPEEFADRAQDEERQKTQQRK